MAANTVPNVPNAFTPFDEREARRLRRYARRAKRLSECSFLKQSRSVTIGGGTGKGITEKIEHAGEDSRGQFLLLFRPLYLPTEKSGFSKLAAMLRRHAEQRGTAEANEMIDLIGGYVHGQAEILDRSGIVKVLEGTDGTQRTISPGEIFKRWLYGEDFHVDDDKADELEAESLPAFDEWMYLNTAARLGAIYCQFAGFPTAILREPSLLP